MNQKINANALSLVGSRVQRLSDLTGELIGSAFAPQRAFAQLQYAA